MDLYRMKVRRIEGYWWETPYQKFQTIDQHYESDDEAFSGFAKRIAQMNSIQPPYDPERDGTPYRILGGDDEPCLIALPMWIKRQSIGGVKWIDVIKSIPKGPSK